MKEEALRWDVWTLERTLKFESPLFERNGSTQGEQAIQGKRKGKKNGVSICRSQLHSRVLSLALQLHPMVMQYAHSNSKFTPNFGEFASRIDELSNFLVNSGEISAFSSSESEKLLQEFVLDFEVNSRFHTVNILLLPGWRIMLEFLFSSET